MLPATPHAVADPDVLVDRSVLDGYDRLGES